MKVKLDADGLKELCLNHVEKVLFAIFVLYALSVLWSSIGIRGFEKKPDDLQSLVRTANANLQKDETKMPAIDDYRTLMKNVAKPVSEEALKTEVTWNPVLFSELKKREQPKTLKIEELQVTFTRGQVANKDGDEELIRTRACVVTGVIPVREQEKAFTSVLANADSSKKRAADEPTYYMYNIERAEVPDSGDMSDLQWEPIRITSGENFQIVKSFSSSSSSSSSDSYYAPPTLMNNPPEKKDKQETQKSASSSSDQDARGLVPWRSAMLLNPLPPWCKASGDAEDVQINYPKAIDLTKTVAEVKTKVAKPKKKAADADAEAASGDETESEEASESAAATPDSTNEKKAPVRLFQFVDYTVKPGKRYTYRVRIQLHNPNYNFKPTYYVSKEEYTKEKLLPWSEWSDPTPIVETTRDERFLLSNTVALEENKKKLPYLSLMLVKFEETTGKEITPNFSFISCEPTPLESVSRKDKGKMIRQALGAGQYLLLTEAGGAMASDDDAAVSTSKEYDTHFFLLDASVSTDELYSKGKTLKKEERKNMGDADVLYAPTRVLLMDPDGNIAIHSEVVDMEQAYPQLKASTGSADDSLLKPADDGKKRGRRSRKAATEEKELEPARGKAPAAVAVEKSTSELQSSGEQKGPRGAGRRGKNK